MLELDAADIPEAAVPAPIKKKGRKKGTKRPEVRDDLPSSKAPRYQIKRKHVDNLMALLRATGTTQTWDQAVKAVDALIRHTGGKINGSLGNGSETAFWVGKCRFIVHSMHKNSEQLSPDRLYFFRAGLARAGITPESIF